ncbi:hypothetical protein [Actinoplanes sp. NPDC051851]|uniref:hypothetical protein n=1 Tax=Actinoplanes sp. NPDC051851 TaxID=3154753 RepID=UPI0034195308
MIRPSVLLFALLISLPAWYRLVVDELDLTQVLLRFLIAVPIAALLMAGFRFLTAGYGTTTEEHGTPVTPEPMDGPDKK